MSVIGNGTTTVTANGAGEDTLTGAGSGASTMSAAGDHDTFDVTNTLDVITDTSTNGEIDSTVSWTLSGTHSVGVNNLVLTGATSAGHSFTATGNTSGDILTDATTGTTGGNKLVGNSTLGNDTFTVNHSNDVISEAHASGDGGVTDIAVVNSAYSFTLGANIENLNLSSGTGNLVGTGNSLVNDIIGDTGNDTLSDGDTANSGGTGDTLVGHSSTGADTFIVNDSHDVVTESHIKVGSAVSLVESTASFTLGANMEALTLSGTANNITGAGNTVADVLRSSTGGINALIGDGGADTFYLNHASDTATESNLVGGAVVNSTISYTLTANMAALTLSGSTGLSGTGNATADVLTSNTGADTLIGHDALNGTSDTFYVNNLGDKVSEEGTSNGIAAGDLIVSNATFNLGTAAPGGLTTTGVNQLTLTGTAAMTGTGNAGADILRSSAGGINALIGESSTGGDTFYVNHASDTVSEKGTSNTGDLIVSDVSFSLAKGAIGSGTTNVNNLTLTAAGLSGTANAGADTITGSTLGANTLIGGSGVDSLIGQGGADVFQINGAGTTAAETNVAGGAIVSSDVSFALGANMHSLTLTGNVNTLTATGNNAAGVIISDATTGASATGANTLIGAGGSNTFVVSHATDAVSEAAVNGGNDMVQSSASFSLAAVTGGHAINQLTLTGAVHGITGTGNSNNDIIKDMTTGAGGNTLIGGGVGDTFILNHAGDTISEAGVNGGTDLIQSSVTFNLATSVTGHAINQLTMTNTGTTAVTGTGNVGNDTLTSSMTGRDALIGNGLADTFHLNFALDTATELNTSGAAVVDSAISFTLGNHMASLTLTGTGNDSGSAFTSGAETIIGNTGNDVLSDGGNATGAGDVLQGNSGTGADTFITNNSHDTISEGNGGALTTGLIQTNYSLDLATGLVGASVVNRATLTGAGTGLTLTGNTHADVLTDATTGAGGNKLIGDSTGGGDTFIINHAGDTVTELGSTLNEVIISTISQSLTGANAGAITLGGTTANLTATGNTGADTLISSTGGINALIGKSTAGGDSFVINHAGDTITELGASTNDAVTSNITWTLGAGMKDLTLTGITANLTANGNATGDILTSSTGGINALIGNSAAGGDTFYVNHASDTVTEKGASNAGDLISSDVTFDLSKGASGGGNTGVDQLTLTGTTTAAHALTATGNTHADVLTDATTGIVAVANVLHGQAASGNDTFVVDSTADVVSESGTAAADLVESSANWTLGTATHFANLTLTGTNALTGVGNTGVNTITGNANTGHEVLNDGDSIGSVGAGDTLIGNSTGGTDTFIVNDANDHVSEAVTSPNSLIDSSASFNLTTGATGVNQLTLTAASITATGNTAATGDTLADGGTGDTLIGNSSTGDDIFKLTHAGDAVTENHAGGTAIIDSAVSFNLNTGYGGAATGINQLTLTTTATLQTAAGNTSNDTITDTSTAGHNVLSDGAHGAVDTLTDSSTAGDDTFIVNNAGDVVSEIVGSTTGTVDSSVNYTLGAHLNVLNLSGTATIATGNTSGGDTITGNAVNDVISDNGGTGADSLIGATAVTGDTFLVGNTLDHVTEGSSNSASLINVDASGATNLAFTLAGTNVKELEFTTGTGNDTGTADIAGHDTIIGSAGHGGGGNVFYDSGSTVAGNSDTLEGNSSAGADTFFVKNAGDFVTEAGTATTALISTTVGFNLQTGGDGTHTTNVSELTLTGTGTGLTLTGNALNDAITDTTTNGLNILADGAAGTGNGGHDTLTDSSTFGGDTFIVNNVLDSIVETSITHLGTVESGVNFTLGANFNVLTLEGTTADAATGNSAGGDTITGNTINTVISDNNGTGADSLIGMSGGSGDTFVVYNGGDHISESGAATGSLVQVQSGSTAVDFSLAGTHISKMTFFGTGADTGIADTTGGATITGNSGNDSLSDGGDVTVGTGDTLIGHSTQGGDIFVVNNAADSITESANVGGAEDGISTSLANGAFDSLTGAYAGFYNLTLTGATGSTAVGNNLANFITGNSGNDTFVSGTGADTLVGASSAGGDTFEVNNANDSVTETGVDTTALVLSTVNFSLGAVGGNGVNELTLTGTGALTGTGNTSANTIVGNANTSGNDVLSDGGAGGYDTITGNSVSGTDTFIVNNAGDHILEATTATTALIESNAASFSLAGTGVHQLTIENAAGSAAGTGSAGGGDTITGNTSNDTLSDGGGAPATADLLIGNSAGGDDIFQISKATDSITETNGIGAGATIESTISYTLTNTYANLQLVNGATGKVATGNAVADTITDNDTAGGHNTLTDGNAGGHDTLIDTAGNDTFVVSYSNDSVTESNVASTTATVESSISFTLGAHINNLILEGGANISGTGTAAGGNELSGNTGNDVLSDGQSGGVLLADTMIGDSAAGHDTFIVYNSADSITESGLGNANLVEAYNGSYSIATITGIEKLTLEGNSTGITATGNGGSDTIVDNDTGVSGGSNVLFSGSGVDVLTDNSTNGNDTFVVLNTGDTVTETHGTAGVIEFNAAAANVTYTIGTHIESVTLTGTGTDSITGTSGGNETITASSDGGTDIISDGLAAHTLNGDKMFAGANSHDTFIMNYANDTIVGNNSGWSGDVIDYYLTNNASAYTLGTDINNLLIEGTGTGNDSIVANGGNDTISANSHSNVFTDGGAHNGTGVVTSAGGADVFNGGGGFDVFNINNGSDTIVEANPGQYLINSWASFTLSSHLGNLTLQGQQNLTGTASTVGGAVIIGNTGSDVLSDGGDASVGVGDVLIGHAAGGQNDTFVVGNAADTVSEVGGGGSIVEASVNYTLGVGTKTLILTLGGNDSGTGNSAASQTDTLVGNSGNDVLSDGGNDTGTGTPNNDVVGLNADKMIGHSGGAGDTFILYNAGDTVTEEGSATGSVVNSYVSFNLETGGPAGGVTSVNVLNLEGNGTGLIGTANNGSDTLTDNGTSTVGGNELVSGTGVDKLDDESTTGGDTFVVNNTGDTVKEHAGVGVVSSSVTFSLAAVTGAGTVTTLDLTNTTGTVTGTAAAAGGDTISASTASGGIDILVDSAGGADSLVGSTSASVHNTFIMNHATDHFGASAGSHNTIETNLNSTFNDLTADANVTSLVLTAGSQTGTANTAGGNDSILGNGGSDIFHDSGLTGGGNADTLTGTGGADTFNVANAGDVVSETGASATVNSTVSFAMSANMNVLNLTGTGNHMTATGNGGADTITDGTTGGSSGHNVLISGTGVTTLTDSSVVGSDTFFVNNAGDTVTEGAGNGVVNSTVSFTLGANMSTLTLTGDVNLSGTGNSGADTITGNDGDDVFRNGVGGNASMIGMSVDGGDTFNVSNASDVVSELNGGGTAVVNATFSAGTFALGANIDNLILSGAYGTDTLTGNGTADNITMTDSGSVGHNIFDANGTGADTLTDSGTGGSDIFDVNNANDVVTESTGTTGVINFGATGNVTFTLTGTHITKLDASSVGGNDTLTAGTGATGADTIIGSTGSDLITDGGGADSLVGNTSAGTDTFVVTSTTDHVDESNAGHGLIQSTVSWSLAANTVGVTSLELTGNNHGGGITATGSGSGTAVTLTDDVGGNTLDASSDTGADTLIGGADTMKLGSGASHVEFSAAVGYNGVATINGFVHSHDVLDIDSIITGGNGGNNVSYKLVTDADTTDTDLLVDYNHLNPSYSFVEVAKIIGLTITAADIT